MLRTALRPGWKRSPAAAETSGTPSSASVASTTMDSSVTSPTYQRSTGLPATPATRSGRLSTSATSDREILYRRFVIMFSNPFRKLARTVCTGSRHFLSAGTEIRGIELKACLQ